MIATAVGLCLLAAEYRWAAPLWSRDAQDQMAYEQEGALRARYDPHYREPPVRRAGSGPPRAFR